ncbi:MAG: DUF748 domain-containing protein [Deltaproteobacteria bacterium]|nr:DUF748 domain-containing protein [Deltaproteobacteria bacterium]
MKLKNVTGIAVLFIVVVSFIVFVSVVVLFFNANRILKSKVESYLGKNFFIGSIHAGWGKIDVVDLRIKDNFGKEVGKTEKVTVTADFFDFLLGKKYSVSQVRIINPYFLIETDSKGKPIFPISIKDQTSDKGSPMRKEKTEKTQFQIKKTEIVNGSIDYIDRAHRDAPVILRFRNLDLELKNVIYPFSQDFIFFTVRTDIPSERSKGRMDAFGKTNILTKDTESDIKVRNLDLKVFEPYYGKTAKHFKIEKGFLDLDMKLKINSGKLHAPCKVVIRDLKVSSSTDVNKRIFEETIKGALSILKNQKDEIKLDFVLSGTIDDPQFNLREAIIKSIIKEVGEKLGILIPSVLRKSTF